MIGDYTNSSRVVTEMGLRFASSFPYQCASYWCSQNCGPLVVICYISATNT